MRKAVPYLVVATTVIVMAAFIWYALAQKQSAQINSPQKTISSDSEKTLESTPTPEATPSPAPIFHYIEIIGGCGPYFNKTPCVNMRSGPGAEYPVVLRLRNGVVLQVEAEATTSNGKEWYKIIVDKTIRYPERVKEGWYVAVDPESVMPFENSGDELLTPGTVASTTKRILVDISEQTLYAYDAGVLIMKEPVSTGLELTPTPPGIFKVYKKTPSRYMQGPIPNVSDQYYDLPGVPWNLYFTVDGAVIHGAYWHDHFGHFWSHGCVNLPPDKAKELYDWADIGTPVIVQI